MTLHRHEKKRLKGETNYLQVQKTTHKKRELKANDKCQGEAWSLLDYLFYRGEKDAGDQSVGNWFPTGKNKQPLKWCSD